MYVILMCRMLQTLCGLLSENSKTPVDMPFRLGELRPLP